MVWLNRQNLDAAITALLPTGTRGIEYNASLKSPAEIHTGVLLDPSGGTTADAGARIIHLVGGFADASNNPQLVDSAIAGVAALCNIDDEDNYRLSHKGATVTIPLYPGGDAGVFTGGSASAGSDQFGGAELADIAKHWSISREAQATTAGGVGTAKLIPGQSCVYGASAGVMRGMMLMRDYGWRPDVFLGRSPWVNMYDWDGIATATQDALSAVMSPSIDGGWTSPSTTTFANLTQAEKNALYTRSPAQWDWRIWRRWQDVKFCMVYGENDTVVPLAWVKQLVENMQMAGVHCELINVSKGDHAWTDADAQAVMQQEARDFIHGCFKRMWTA